MKEILVYKKIENENILLCVVETNDIASLLKNIKEIEAATHALIDGIEFNLRELYK